MTLPQGWAWTTLGEISDTTQLRVNPQEHPTLPYIGMENVEAHTMRLLGTVPANEMRSTAESFAPGDVLYGRLRPYLNKVLCPDFSGLCSTEFIAFRKSPHLDGKYLQYFLNSWDFVSFASHLNAGDRPRVNFIQLADYPFPFAPLPEQHRIVAKIEELLTRLDAGVAALRRAQANLKRYKAAVLKAACEGRLVPQDPNDEPASALLERISARRGDPLRSPRATTRVAPTFTAPNVSELPELPGGWRWASLQQCFAVERGRFSVRPRNDPRYYNGPYPFVQIGDLPRDGGSITSFSQTLNEKGFRISRMFRKGTVLIAIVGATIANTGVLAFDSCCPDSLVAIQSDDESRLRFVELYLQSKKLEIRSASYASGGQPNINLATLLPYPVPVPPLAEQRRIVAEVERRLSVVQEVEAVIAANLARAERLRQSILKQAFEGKLVSQDVNDEPASVLLERIRAQRAEVGAIRESPVPKSARRARRTSRVERNP